jgi:acyl-coenzyme A thioesterase PaaI-like protein
MWASAAVQTTAERGTDFAALGMKINLLRSVHQDGQQLVATGTVLHRGAPARHRTAEVRHGGRLVAVIIGTTELTRGGT